jgi:hypothetical protein
MSSCLLVYFVVIPFFSGDYLFVFGGLMDTTDDKYNMCPDGGACNDM